MPKMDCKCGYRFSLSRSPTEDEWLLVPERELEFMEGAQVVGSQAIDRIVDKSLQVLRCPNCKRLWIQEEHDSNSYVEYTRAPG